MDCPRCNWLLSREGKCANPNCSKRITRFEVIDYRRPAEDGGGRIVHVGLEDGGEISYEVQDDGRTLKVFIEERD